MFLRTFLLALGLIIIVIPQSQKNNHGADYLHLYETAEKLYNSENPTDYSDSLALLNYSGVISILEKNNSNDSVLFDCYIKSGIISMSKKEDRQSLNFFCNQLHF